MWLHYKVKPKTPSILLNLKRETKPEKDQREKKKVIKETETVKPAILAYLRILWWLQTKFIWPCQSNEWSRSMSWQITCTVWGVGCNLPLQTIGPKGPHIIWSYLHIRNPYKQVDHSLFLHNGSINYQVIVLSYCMHLIHASRTKCDSHEGDNA